MTRLFKTGWHGWLVLLGFFPFCTSAQTYTDEALNLGIIHNNDPDAFWGAGVSFVDIDGDNRDDISICQKGDPPLFYFNNGDGFTLVDDLVDVDDEVKALSWVDFDNDGDKDLFVTCYLAPYRLYENEGGVMTEITTAAGFGETYNQTFGHSWGDYNLDGYLDVYINNYNYFDGIANEFYHNNGDGTFTEMSVELGIDNGPNFSFQSLWIDYNDDGLQDLFIINDRTYSKNHMYKNLGDGEFVDVTDELGFDHYIFSMSNTGGDYDNDGDLDIYVTNNPEGHLLHQQMEDGTFMESADQAGVATYDMGWAAQWMDYDLDGWQDLHVNCSPFWFEDGQNKFYINNGDGTFDYDISMGFQGDETWSHSSAVGDYNDDGMFDIIIVNDAPYITSLWTSQNTSGNNFLKVRLEGTMSNRDGVGSKIRCYTDTLTQLRHTYCGEGYMSQNSQTEIFGLGQYDIIDSLTVTWLSGHVDTFYDLEVNQTLDIFEGSSLSFDLAMDGNVLLCEGDSLVVTAPEFASYNWSNGDTTQTVVLTSAGGYQLEVVDDMGFTIMSEPLNIEIVQNPVYSSAIQHNLCFGDSLGEIDLDISPDVTINWEGEFEGTSLDNLTAGAYEFTLLDSNLCLTQGEITIAEPTEISAEMSTMDVLCYGEMSGTASAFVQGGTGNLELEWDNADPDGLAAGQYTLTVTDSLGCSIEELFQIYEPDELTIDLEITEAMGDLNGAVTIYAFGGTAPFTFVVLDGSDEVDADDLEAGTYTAQIIDENGCIVSSEFSIINLGIEAIAFSQLSILPNPATGGTLEVRSDYQMAEIRIYNSIGQEIEQLSLNGIRAIKMDCSAWENGMYIIQARLTDGTVISARIHNQTN